MNQQEATRSVIVCGLRAGRTMKEIMSYGNIKKSTVDVERKLEKFIAPGGSADRVLTGRKRTTMAVILDELITRNFGRSIPPPPSAGDEHFRTNMRG